MVRKKKVFDSIGLNFLSKEMQPAIIVLEGSIAVGKTTLIEALKNDLERKGKKVTIINEPIEDETAGRILKKFYEDPKEYGYAFQTYIFSRRIRNAIDIYENNKDTDIFLMERSWLSDPIFVAINRDLGNMNDIEFDCYREWYDFHERMVPFKLNSIVYLRCSPETSLERIKQRKREGEDRITQEYLETLLHEYDGRMGDSLIPVKTVSTEESVDVTELTDFILN
jgi:deoxyadenosine/deoxycytidine kinase